MTGSAQTPSWYSFARRRTARSMSSGVLAYYARVHPIKYVCEIQGRFSGLMFSRSKASYKLVVWTLLADFDATLQIDVSSQGRQIVRATPMGPCLRGENHLARFWLHDERLPPMHAGCSIS